jgi:5-methylcytosine-specific restriction endonuclease McrA
MCCALPLQYVPYYSGTAVNTPVSIDPSYPWVRDKTYKLTFYRGAKY